MSARSYIVDDREKNGPFTSIEDLDRVQGIGTKKIEAIRPFIQMATNEEGRESQ